MELTKERVIEIIKENFWIANVRENLGGHSLHTSFVGESGNNKWDFDLEIRTPRYIAVLPLEIDYSEYDEKFVDANKYEVDDMGLKISIINRGADSVEPLSEESIWKHLFFEKEPLSIQ